MQLLVQVASRRYGQRSNELFKLYGAVLRTKGKQLSLPETTFWMTIISSVTEKST
jgi:hypothetical protein